MTEPIIEFKDEVQAYKCLKEWQTRLFLNDWAIKVSLKNIEEMDDCWGLNNLVFENMDCHIKLLENADNSTVLKFCHEKILVHELFHCKYYYAISDESNPKYVEDKEHQLLEQMAKSLIMAKYNLPFEWFKNF